MYSVTEKFSKLINRKESLSSDINSGLQNSKNKLTARQRINILLDHESFEEYGLFIKHRSSNFDMQDKSIPLDGVVTGYGKIFGNPVLVFSQDFTVAGGSLGEMHAKKIIYIQKKAMELKIPIIGINDSGGARIQEGIDALAGYGEIFQNNIELSGVVPQISLIMGPCAGGAVYSPALTDFIFMTKKTSLMFITGPDVIKEVTMEEISHEKLGGSDVHSKKTGSCDACFLNDIELINEVRKFFTFLPQSSSHYSKLYHQNNEKKNNIFLNNYIPQDSNSSYDMKKIIFSIIDSEDFFELKSDFAKNIITALARIDGKTVGIIANQPLEKAGCIDINASRKAARFIRFCDSFNIPIVTFVDTPGFLPGSSEEHGNIIQHGAKLLYAYGEATVPKITITTRKAYGGAYIVMGSKHLKSDFNYVWPTAEIAVLGSRAAAKILFKKTNSKEEYDRKIEEYEEKFINPYFAAERGYVDSIIKPEETRDIIIKSLNLLKDKSKPNGKKHDNLPL